MKEKTRTYKEWIATFPEPYRSKAIRNISKAAHDYNQRIILRECLYTMFDWGHSPEGGDYWIDFKDTMLNEYSSSKTTLEILNINMLK